MSLKTINEIIFFFHFQVNTGTGFNYNGMIYFVGITQDGRQYPISLSCGDTQGLNPQPTMIVRTRCCNTNLCNTMDFGLQDNVTLTAADSSGTRLEHLFGTICFVTLISFFKL